VGGTPKFLEDTRRGLYSYEALKTRLISSRFSNNGFKDTSGPVIRLQMLSHDEVYVLLTYLIDIFNAHYRCESRNAKEELQMLMQEVINRLGAEALMTPREVIREFLNVLNILRQNPEATVTQIIHGSDYQPTFQAKDPDLDEDGEFAEFSL
jgi:hypothetical protein